MTKDELVAAVASATSQSETDVALTVDAAITEIAGGLSGGGGVVHLGPLGTFSTRLEAAHTGSNPQTHEPLEIPASVRVLFHPSGMLREAVNDASGE